MLLLARTNNLKNLVIKHRDTYSNFILINAFKVDNKLQIENAIKENKTFTERLRNITLGNKKICQNVLTFSEFLDRNQVKQLVTLFL